MSWFDPPPLVKKPANPFQNLPRIPRQSLVFWFTLLMWMATFQLAFLLLLVLRMWLFKTASFWFPMSWAWWLIGTIFSLFFGLQMAGKVIAFLAHHSRLDKPDQSR